MMAAPTNPSHRLCALIHQLRHYKPDAVQIPGEKATEDEAAALVSEGGGRDLDDRGKVFSSIGFSESASPSRILLSPERFHPKRAAVLICLFEGENGDLRVILTKRSSNLSTHSGEVSLPGGKAEAGDADDCETATREAKEEIGLDPSLVTVVAILEPFLSRHLLRVVPVIGVLTDKKAFMPIPNAAEVETIFDAPLEMFLKTTNYWYTRQVEDMQKGASNADLKKSATPDDDFGKDFFNSWKSTELGNDSMDFDMETVPKNKKASFKFDELDNFELSGNFDKLPSFKLDVPDLDFSGLSKKNEKTNDKSSKEFVKGKKESKDDKFSFDFDFNSFDLDSKSPEDKRPSNFSDKNVPEHPSKHEKNQESGDSNPKSTNISRDQRSDFAHKTELSIGKKATIPEDNEKKTCVTMARRVQSQGNYLAKENSVKNQYFCLQSFSGDGSAEVTLPEIQTDSAPSDVVKPREIMEEHDSMQPISSSPSMSSSPVDSYDSGCWTKASGDELPNPGSVLQNQRQGSLTEISGSHTSSIQIRKDSNNSTGPKISIEGVKNIDEKQNSCQNLILPPEKQNSRQNLMLPPLKSEITFGGSTKLRGLMSTGLQLKTIRKLEDNIPQQLPAFISKPFNSTLEARAKTTHASTTNESSLLFKTSSASHQTSMGAKKVARPSLQKLITDATIDPKVSSAGNNTGSVKENVIAKLVSSDRLGSQIIKTNKGATSGDSNHRGILDSAIAKTIEVNKNKPNSAKPSEEKSVRFLEKRMECPLNVASKTTNLANIEKKSSLHASLKRKIDEQSVADLETSSSLTCVKESNASRRISFEASPNTKRKMVPEIKITETCKDLTPVANQTSLTAVPEMGNLVAGVSSFFVEDDNLRKAETLSKELDNICNIARKKHEEAREHQVRSIINNNALLLLNYPVLEEKIQALQKFTSNLLLMEI